MEPFKVHSEIASITSNYPDAKSLIQAAKDGGNPSKIAIASLWLSEGIPYAFKNNPALYEAVRSWLCTRLSVNAKDIHLTGSARLGQSMAPTKLGRAFGKHSDLDIFIVSSSLFEQLSQEFNDWSYRFEMGIEVPSPAEQKFWPENLERGPKNLRRGFIDPSIIPNRVSFPITKNISQSMYLLKLKLDQTANSPSITEASVRCYKNWESYIQQSLLNFQN